MRVLPFPCIRPVAEAAEEAASFSYGALSPEEASGYIERRLEDGFLVRDKNAAYYIYELSREGLSQTGVVGVCAVDEYLDGSIRHFDSSSTEAMAEDIVRAEALGVQVPPVILAYRDQPVLDIIIAAAKAATPIYAFTDKEGATHRAWEVARKDAVDSVHVMFEQVPTASVTGAGKQLALFVQLSLKLREEAEAAGTYTGKEPFNYFLAALFPTTQPLPAEGPLRSAESDELEGVLQGGLFMHQVVRW